MGTNESLEISSENRTLMNRQAQKISVEKLIEMIRLFNQAAIDGRIGWHPGLNLELALAESCEEKQPVQIIERVVEKTTEKTAEKKSSEFCLRMKKPMKKMTSRKM